MRRLTTALADRSSGMRGRVGSDQVRLTRRIFYRNSFQPRLIGRLREGQAGTSIEVTVGMHPAVWVFMGFWVLMLAPTAIGFGAQALAELLRRGTTDVAIPTLAVCGMLLFGVFMTLGGRWLARSEPAELVSFLRTATLAEERSPGTAPPPAPTPF